MCSMSKKPGWPDIIHWLAHTCFYSVNTGTDGRLLIRVIMLLCLAYVFILRSCSRSSEAFIFRQQYLPYVDYLFHMQNLLDVEVHCTHTCHRPNIEVYADQIYLSEILVMLPSLLYHSSLSVLADATLVVTTICQVKDLHYSHRERCHFLFKDTAWHFYHFRSHTR